jgi:glycosyltransferase involved in cell wall biosynthesis
MKSVTIIIPTYNRWPLICSSIDSVLKQSYQNTKCMVVDDASTDNTVELLTNKYGKQIELISSSKNKGQSYCRNLGALMSKSDCIGFLDSDDLLENDAVEKRIAFFNENKKDVAVSFGLIRTPGMKEHPFLKKKKDGDLLILSEYLDHYSWCHNNGFLINRNIFLRDGKYNEKLRNKEDIELLLRLLSKYSFYYCGTEIGQVRDVCNNRARNNYKKIISQSNLFSDIILRNTQLKKILDSDTIYKIICTDMEEELRALYKLGQYKEYCSLYKHTLKNNYITYNKRFLKRYIIALIKGFLYKK